MNVCPVFFCVTEKLNRVTDLLKALGVTTLSACVEVTPTTEMYEPCPALQLYVHRVVPVIQRLLYTEHEDVYAELKEKHIKGKLAVLRFAQVRKLAVSRLCQNCELSVSRFFLKNTNSVLMSYIIRFSYCQVSKLEIVYRLQNVPDCEPIVKSESCRLINDQEFNILKDKVKSYGDINRELSRFFSRNNRTCDSNIR